MTDWKVEVSGGRSSSTLTPPLPASTINPSKLLHFHISYTPLLTLSHGELSLSPASDDLLRHLSPPLFGVAARQNRRPWFLSSLLDRQASFLFSPISLQTWLSLDES